jgi:predicted nucleotidyltransferase
MIKAVPNKTTLFSILSENAEAIRACGISRIGVFGSFVRDSGIHKKSDVDFLVDFKRGQKNLHNLVVLGDLLEEKLGRRVELVTRASLRDPVIGPKILATAENVPL